MRGWYKFRKDSTNISTFILDVKTSTSSSQTVVMVRTNDDLTINCSLDQSEVLYQYNVSDITIKLNKQLVSQDSLHMLNSTTLQLHLRTLNRTLNGSSIACYARDTLFTNMTLLVGGKLSNDILIIKESSIIVNIKLNIQKILF